MLIFYTRTDGAEIGSGVDLSMGCKSIDFPQENHAWEVGRQRDGAEIGSSVDLSMGCKSIDFP